MTNVQLTRVARVLILLACTPFLHGCGRQQAEREEYTQPEILRIVIFVSDPHYGFDTVVLALAYGCSVLCLFLAGVSSRTNHLGA